MSVKPRPNLTVSEVSGLSGLSEPRIRKSIRERQIRSRKRGAHVYVSVVDAVLLSLCDELDVPLKQAQKQQLRGWLERRPWESAEAQSLALGNALQVIIPEHTRQVAEHASRYAEAKEQLIHRDPLVKAGEPVISGSRVSVYAVLGRLDRGETVDDLLEDFPHLSRESIEVAALYARANPRRGRPARSGSAT